jgi:hypothetical protein
MARINSPAKNPKPLVLVKGFCRNPAEKAALIAFGLTERIIYMDKNGAENIDTCINSFRRETPEDRFGGALLVVPGEDIRLFGEGRKAISKITDRLERLQIKLLNIAHQEDVTYSAHNDRASTAIAAQRFKGNRRAARRAGSSGGLAKKANAAAKRDALMREDIVRRMVTHPKLTINDCAGILGEGFSAATLRRCYL